MSEKDLKHREYWETFYNEFKLQDPSNFAVWFQNRFNFRKNVVEFGCGSGRDSYYLASQGNDVIGVDFASNLTDATDFHFVKVDISTFINEVPEGYCEFVYTRFFLHSIEDSKIDKLLKWTKNYFVAEFREKDDVPILYPDHYRNKIDGNKFLQKLLKNNFRVLYFEKNTNFANYKEENPIVVRVIAKKETK